MITQRSWSYCCVSSSNSIETISVPPIRLLLVVPKQGLGNVQAVEHVGHGELPPGISTTSVVEKKGEGIRANLIVVVIIITILILSF